MLKSEKRRIDGTNQYCWAELHEDGRLRMGYVAADRDPVDIVNVVDSEGHCTFLPVKFAPYSLVVFSSDTAGDEYYAELEDGKPVVRKASWWY